MKFNVVIQDVVTLHSTSGGSDLFLSLPGSYLIISFTKKIITAALDAQQDKHSLAETRFMEVQSALQESDLLQLYVNYRMLQKFMACYSDGTNEYVHRLSQTLITTSLDMTLEEEIIKATGYTYVNDSLDSYPKTLLISGKAPTEFLGIAPQRTAFCLGLGFTSFDLFYKNFEKNLQQDVADTKRIAKI